VDVHTARVGGSRDPRERSRGFDTGGVHDQDVFSCPHERLVAAGIVDESNRDPVWRLEIARSDRRRELIGPNGIGRRVAVVFAGLTYGIDQTVEIGRPVAGTRWRFTGDHTDLS
jgi:hypothetical protein